MKYVRSRKQLQKKAEEATGVVTVATNHDADKDADNERNAEEDLLFLQTVVITEQNKHIAEVKIRNTSKLRMQMLNDENLNMLEHFPFLFTHPELVTAFMNSYLVMHSTTVINFNPLQILVDYASRNMNINVNSLLEKWPLYSIRLNEIKDTNYGNLKILKNWSPDISTFLVLMKVLHKSYGGRKGELRPTFESSVEKLIVFRLVSFI